MNRYGFVMAIKSGFEEEYRTRHAQVYPALLEAFTRLGIHDYSIFLHGELAFAYMTVDGDFERIMRDLGHEPANHRWQKDMASIMQLWPDGTVMKRLPEVFYHQ